MRSTVVGLSRCPRILSETLDKPRQCPLPLQPLRPLSPATLNPLYPSHYRAPPMAKNPEKRKELTSVERRVARIASHLLPSISPLSPAPPIVRSVASAEDSYRRVHGEVSAKEAAWREVCDDESGKGFVDIIYEKALGEGIAKVL